MDDKRRLSEDGHSFSDLNLPRAQERRQKSELVVKLRQAADAQGMAVGEVAMKLGLTSFQTAALLRGGTEQYSLADLQAMLEKVQA